MMTITNVIQDAGNLVIIAGVVGGIGFWIWFFFNRARVELLHMHLTTTSAQCWRLLVELENVSPRITSICPTLVLKGYHPRTRKEVSIAFTVESENRSLAPYSSTLVHAIAQLDGGHYECPRFVRLYLRFTAGRNRVFYFDAEGTMKLPWLEYWPRRNAFVATGNIIEAPHSFPPSQLSH